MIPLTPSVKGSPLPSNFPVPSSENLCQWRCFGHCKNYDAVTGPKPFNRCQKKCFSITYLETNYTFYDRPGDSLGLIGSFGDDLQIDLRIHEIEGASLQVHLEANNVQLGDCRLKVSGVWGCPVIVHIRHLALVKARVICNKPQKFDSRKGSESFGVVRDITQWHSERGGTS